MPWTATACSSNPSPLNGILRSSRGRASTTTQQTSLCSTTLTGSPRARRTGEPARRSRATSTPSTTGKFTGTIPSTTGGKSTTRDSPAPFGGSASATFHKSTARPRRSGRRLSSRASSSSPSFPRSGTATSPTMSKRVGATLGKTRPRAATGFSRGCLRPTATLSTPSSPGPRRSGRRVATRTVATRRS